VFRKTKLAVAVLAALTFSAGASNAQSFSEGYKFLEAVKKRDGAAVDAALASSVGRIVNTKNGDTGEAAVHIVTRDRDARWLRYLLSKGARPDPADRNGDTPLTLATQLGWTDGVTALLESGAKIDGANARGETPLILAVHKRDVPMIRLLLEKGADPKRGDRIAGYSALDYARRDDRSGAIVRLLELEQKPAKAAAGPPR
jgi:ankyrin repeat protein